MVIILSKSTELYFFPLKHELPSKINYIRLRHLLDIDIEEKKNLLEEVV